MRGWKEWRVPFVRRSLQFLLLLLSLVAAEWCPSTGPTARTAILPVPLPRAHRRLTRCLRRRCAASIRPLRHRRRRTPPARPRRRGHGRHDGPARDWEQRVVTVRPAAARPSRASTFSWKISPSTVWHPRVLAARAVHGNSATRSASAAADPARRSRRVTRPGQPRRCSRTRSRVKRRAKSGAQICPHLRYHHDRTRETQPLHPPPRRRRVVVRRWPARIWRGAEEVNQRGCLPRSSRARAWRAVWR